MSTQKCNITITLNDRPPLHHLTLETTTHQMQPDGNGGLKLMVHDFDVEGSGLEFVFRASGGEPGKSCTLSFTINGKKTDEVGTYNEKGNLVLLDSIDLPDTDN